MFEYKCIHTLTSAFADRSILNMNIYLLVFISCNFKSLFFWVFKEIALGFRNLR